MHAPPTIPTERWTARRAGLALAAITLLALGLRLTGIGFLLPTFWEPDQRVYTTQVELLRASDPHPERDVDFGWYPLLVARIAASLPDPRPAVPPATLEEHLDAAGAQRRQIRSVIACLSVLLVPAVYLLARRFVRRDAALLAALLAAASTLHLWYAQQTRPHGASSAFIAWTLVAALAIRRRGTLPTYLGAGVALGLAVSVLQGGLAGLPPILAAHVLGPRRTWCKRTAWLLAALAITFGFIRVFYPFIFLPSAGFGADAAQFGVGEGQVNLSGHRFHLTKLNGHGFGVLLQAFWSYDPLLLALAAAALPCAFLLVRRSGPRSRPRWWPRLRRHADALVVLAFVLPFVLLFGMYGLTFVRFALPLVAIAALAAAVLYDRTRSLTGRRLILAACALQVVCALRLAHVRSRPDTARRAAAWIAANVDPERQRIVVDPGQDLPLLRHAESLAGPDPLLGIHNYPWVNYQAATPHAARDLPAFRIANLRFLRSEQRQRLFADPRAWILSQDADYVVVAVGCNAGTLELNQIEAGTRAAGELVARVSPLLVGRGDDGPLRYQDDSEIRKICLWWRVLVADSMGPVFEIYRLPRR